LYFDIEYPPASPERLAMAGRSNKEFRTAEVFEKSETMFFTSIFCGSLFCGSEVHILKEVIEGSSIDQNYYLVSEIY
jgi:hypothetical protein